MASKSNPVENQGKDSQKSQIPRALSLIRRGMAFMKKNSPIRTSQLKRSDSGPSVRPKKWAEKLDQPVIKCDKINSVQDSSRCFKATKSPNKLMKQLNNTKKSIPKASPYSYSSKKPQPSRIPVRKCISVTPIGERIASLESQEKVLMDNLQAVREKLEHLKELRYDNIFVHRLNCQSSSQQMPKIEESDMENYCGSPSIAYLRPMKPRRLSVKYETCNQYSNCI